MPVVDTEMAATISGFAPLLLQYTARLLHQQPEPHQKRAFITYIKIIHKLDHEVRQVYNFVIRNCCGEIVAILTFCGSGSSF